MSHPGEVDAPHPVLDDERGSSYVEALEAERAGYLERGLDDRAAQVDAELARERGGAVPVASVEAGEPETAEESDPVETAVPAKAKRARKR